MFVTPESKDALLSIPMTDVCSVLGIEMEPRDGRMLVRCPFHPLKLGRIDRNIGNASIVHGTDGHDFIHCFSCGGHGGTIDVVMAVKGIKFFEACEFLAEQFHPELLKYKPAQKFKKVPQCPFSDEELEIIGMHAGTTIEPLGTAENKYSVKHPDDDKYGDINWYDVPYDRLMSTSEIGDPMNDEILVCRTSTYGPRQLFQDDPECFYDMTRDNAIYALRRYRKMAEEISANVPPGSLYEALKDEVTVRAEVCRKIYHLSSNRLHEMQKKKVSA
jgi:hypothetical protein